jgi:serine/threonine protein kinase
MPGQLPKEECNSSESVTQTRLTRAIASLRLLKHPSIYEIRQEYTMPTNWYVLFDHTDGVSLLDYIISHGQLREKVARRIARQLAGALDYCHRNNIAHRDVKIENIIISKSQDIKLTGFMMSSFFFPQSCLETYCGSSFFPAPELLEGKPYIGPAVDVWSFGVVLYILVCGRVPFDDSSMSSLHKKIKSDSIEVPRFVSSGE